MTGGLKALNALKSDFVGGAGGAGCGGGNFAVLVEGKLSPLKASVRPPKEFC